MIDPTLEESQRLSAIAAPLFAEFTNKLAAMRYEALQLHDKITGLGATEPAPWNKNPAKQLEHNKLVNHYQAIMRRLDSLEPVISKFARQISQRLEHTPIDEIIRIELEARLADLQSELRTTRDYLNTYLP